MKSGLHLQGAARARAKDADSCFFFLRQGRCIRGVVLCFLPLDV